MQYTNYFSSPKLLIVYLLLYCTKTILSTLICCNTKDSLLFDPLVFTDFFAEETLYSGKEIYKSVKFWIRYEETNYVDGHDE